MKVAIVSYIYDLQAGGGAVRSARMLAQGLADRGDSVAVITTTRERRLRVEREGDVTVYSFLPRNLYWVGDKDEQPMWKRVPWQLLDMWNLHAYRVVRGILRRERPDIVHVNKLRGLSPSVWAAAGAEGIPIVHTCRDYELFSPEGTLESRVGAWAERGTWFMRPYSSLRAGLSRAVAAAVAPSRYTLDAHLQRGFFPRATSRVIPNSHGLTLQALERVRATSRVAEGPDVRLLYLGRLEQAKGVDLLCEAVAACADRCPNLRLDVAGWGTLEGALRRRYGGHPRIAFHGAVFGEAKARLLAECDAMVVPSVYPEIFGNVVVEAYAFGKPVIAAASGGLPELVAPGETGWLVPPGDARALAEVIGRIAGEPSLARRMALACFEAARRYALERVVEEYRSLYQAVLEGKVGENAH
ncbi:MAG: glycosyltransferase family 4 protein [Chloroflexi bacterium]|nr:glycosyltransferase family 4 protein [Chloroflexota bacterium]